MFQRKQNLLRVGMAMPGRFLVGFGVAISLAAFTAGVRVWVGPPSFELGLLGLSSAGKSCFFSIGIRVFLPSY